MANRKTKKIEGIIWIMQSHTSNDINKHQNKTNHRYSQQTIIPKFTSKKWVKSVSCSNCKRINRTMRTGELSNNKWVFCNVLKENIELLFLSLLTLWSYTMCSIINVILSMYWRMAYEMNEEKHSQSLHESMYTKIFGLYNGHTKTIDSLYWYGILKGDWARRYSCKIIFSSEFKYSVVIWTHRYAVV